MARGAPPRRLVATLAALWCLSGTAQEPRSGTAAQETLPGASVESLLALARQGNPDYAMQLREAEAAAERAVPAGALPDPRVRIELMDVTRGDTQTPTLLPNRTGSTRYWLMQEIPWFGKRDLRREIAELEARGARGRAEGAWHDVATRIKTTYAQAWYLAANEALSREILDLNARLERIAQARYAAGLAAQQDVIRAQVEQTGLRNELITVETERHHLHARMNALLGRPAGAPLATPERLRPLPGADRLDAEALETRARAGNPLLLSEDARLRAAEKSRDLAFRNRYPDVTLGLVPNQFQNSVKQWDVMLELSVPLQQPTRRAQEREALAMLEAARARRSAAANQVQAELAENLAALAAARRAEALATDSLLPQASLTFQSALAGYETGKVDFATLLDAQRQIRQARLTRLRAQAEAQARLADIERILGEDL